MTVPHVDLDKALGHEFKPANFTYNDRDVILYALGIGAGRDPMDEVDLPLVYELRKDDFKVFPTFGVIFPSVVMSQVLSLPGMTYNPMMLLHGEQYLELPKPLPTAATVLSKARVSQIYDKGKGALVVVDATAEDAEGEVVAKNKITLFIRGIGGFGGDRGPSTSHINRSPDRSPDAVYEERVPANQALLYRLTGDRNPLHADPAMAASGGFDRPILHGLCTFGFAARAILRKYANNDVSRFKSISVRFSRHFFPGETLHTEMWDEGDGNILFRCKALERDEYVLTNSKLTLT